MAEVATQGSKGICGLVLLSGVGRPAGIVIREQLASLPDPMKAEAFAALSELEAGRTTEGRHSARALEIYRRRGERVLESIVLNNLGGFAYAIPVPASGTYTVRLRFAGPRTESGSRSSTSPPNHRSTAGSSKSSRHCASSRSDPTS